MGRLSQFQGWRAGLAPSGRRLAVPVIAMMVALSAGCVGSGEFGAGHPSLPEVAGGAANPVPVDATAGSDPPSVDEGAAPSDRPAASPRSPRVPTVAGNPVAVAAAPNLAPAAPAAALGGTGGHGEATTSGETSTVEELLEDGLYGAGASPVHLAIRGTPAADSVRCGWRGIARTAQQREDAIRFWLRLDATEAIPSVGALEILFAVVLDALDPLSPRDGQGQLSGDCAGAGSRWTTCS